MNPAELTAASLSLACCRGCDLVVCVGASESAGRALCPRCGSWVHLRKMQSLQRTWAFLLAATILYLPANLLPIMSTTWAGNTRRDTILSGVEQLFRDGMWPLALLVFFASIVVPLLKIVAMSLLLVSVHRRSRRMPVRRTRIYRMVEGIGRWSMVDIYAVTILVALVKLGALARVEAEAGAFFFGAVVVISMFAAASFDPRLIWDRRG